MLLVTSSHKLFPRALSILALTAAFSAGCQSVQPSLRLQKAQSKDLAEPKFESDKFDDFRASKLLELENGVVIRIGTPEELALESLGHPALKIYEGTRVVWVLADSSEISIVDGAVSDIEFSPKAYFDENGYYIHHRMRHHGAVEPVLSAIAPRSKRKKKSSLKKLPNPPKIIRGPWVWHGPLFGQRRVRRPVQKVVRKPRRTPTRRRGGISIILIR